jgi:hypothetical protein
MEEMAPPDLGNVTAASWTEGADAGPSLESVGYLAGEEAVVDLSF